MGTNYYWYERGPCEKCGGLPEKLHIGKSSAGWCFSLHVYAELGIRTLDDWRAKFNQPGAYILNEYTDTMNPDEMVEVITNRTGGGFKVKPMGYAGWPDFHDRNGSEPGPNGLLRHVAGWFGCVGNGEGTWDYIVGEFS